VVAYPGRRLKEAQLEVGMTIKVYRFALYPIGNDETLSHGYATMEFIVLNKLTALPGSEMDVDPTHVDQEGRYLGLNSSQST
jgi:hypothetical protein